MTKHVADDQLASFTRKTWELQRRLREGTLDPVEVNRGLQKIIQGAIIVDDDCWPSSIKFDLDFHWQVILHLQDVNGIMFIVSSYLLGNREPYRQLLKTFIELHERFRDEDYHLIRSNMAEKPRLKIIHGFPASVIDYLASIDPFLNYDDLMVQFLFDKRDIHCHCKDWVEAIKRFELPIPLLTFNYNFSADTELLEQIYKAANSKECSEIHGMDNCHVTYQKKDYLVVGAKIGNDGTNNLSYFALAPIECFDFTR